MDKRFDGKQMVVEYSGKRQGKLGTKKNPAEVSVQTEKRAEEIRKIFEKNNWIHVISVNEKIPENLNDLEILQNPVVTHVTQKHPGRNEPCSCGSGKKYKLCCGK